MYFFLYAFRAKKDDYVKLAVRLTYATDGGISYAEAKNMTMWELSVICSELNVLHREAKKKINGF